MTARSGPRDPRRAAFFTIHHYDTPRRTGFHHLASAYADLGWRVDFVTVSLSPVSWVIRDERVEHVRASHIRGGDPERTPVSPLVWFTAFHPVNLRSQHANHLSSPLMRLYGRLPMRRILPRVSGAEVVVIESSPAVLLTERLRRCIPQARFVYRQSDAPAAVGFHPAVSQAEPRTADIVDLISVPDASRLPLFETTTPIVVQHHGIDIQSFEAAASSPYDPSPPVRAIFVGMEGLDYWFLDAAATRHPEIAFHVFGPWMDKLKRGNVIFHGVRPFAETVPYIRHADLALNCVHVPEPQYRRKTLKTQQYIYCRLPIVAQSDVAAPFPFIFPYADGDGTSVDTAIRKALAYPRDWIPGGTVQDWKFIASEQLRLIGISA